MLYVCIMMIKVLWVWEVKIDSRPGRSDNQLQYCAIALSKRVNVDISYLVSDGHFFMQLIFIEFWIQLGAVHKLRKQSRGEGGLSNAYATT